MKNPLLFRIVGYSFSRGGMFTCLWCLLKGLCFYSLLRKSMLTREQASANAAGTAGDDIYPLF